MKSIQWIFSGIGVAVLFSIIGLNNEPTAQQTSEGDNSPNINNTSGDVNIDNSTSIENEKPDIPKFSGEIGNGSKSATFREFVDRYDNEVVFLDVYVNLESTTAEDRRERVSVEECDADNIENPLCEEGGNSILLLFDCGEDYGSAAIPCLGTNFLFNPSENANGSFRYAQGAYYVKGFWSVQKNPGSWQGVGSVSLYPVKVQDTY